MSEKAYDNTVLGAGGYSDAGEIDLSKELTGEDTTSSLLDAILPGIPLIGLGIKGGKSIPWGALLERVGLRGGKAAHSQAAKAKFLGLPNREAIKNIERNVANKSNWENSFHKPLMRDINIRKEAANLPSSVNPKDMPIGTLGASSKLPKWANVKGAVAERMPSSNKIRDILMKVAPFLYGGAAGSSIAKARAPELWEGSAIGNFMDWLPKTLRPDPEMPSREELSQYIKENREGVAKPMNMWEYYGDILK